MMIWILCTLALAQTGREVEIHVQDPLRQVVGPLHAKLDGSQGTSQVVRFRDDGTAPDHTPGDGVHSAVVTIPDTMVHLELKAGDRNWTGDAVLPETEKDTVLRLQLGPESGVVVLQGARGMLGGPGPSGSPADGLWIWAVVLAAVGLGFGIALRWVTARPPPSARLRGPSKLAQVPPRRFAPGQVGQVLASLSDQQVFALGPVPEGAAVISCTDARVTPEALIRAVEHAAIPVATPTALVVTDPDALELPFRQAPADALCRVISGRFSLWLVDGPSDWEGPDQGTT